MTLQELAELVEGAEGPSRELDADIAVAVNAGCLSGAYKERADRDVRRQGYVRHFYQGQKSIQEARRYTASLDAAMSLVPEGWALASLSYWPASPEGADEQTGPKASAGLVGASLKRFGRRMVWGHTASDGRADGDAATPALALCAASLKALSKREGE